ncbi:MAG: type II secretion system F family protein, partial [Epsilonproteobacteria bacterium]|nr:type II secretion system F family protein [Campylobacterota bacterium]
MKYYNVHILTKGRRHSILLKAQDKKDAIRKAKSTSGGIVVRAEETSPPIEESLKEFKEELLTRLRRSRIRRRDLIGIVRQLAVMTNAGIPIHDALTEIANSTTNRRIRDILSDLAENINAGVSFSQALERYRSELGSLSVTMIRLGEQTGDMAHALFTLASILERIDENVRKFKKAIRYPLITLAAMAVAFTILITFVVPKF